MVLGICGGNGPDPSENGADWDGKPQRLFAENGGGRVHRQTGFAGAEGAGVPPAPKQQQPEPADP